jgi:hypothetical protein
MEKEEYDLPEVEEVYFDTKSHDLVDSDQITSAYEQTPETPFERIKHSAASYDLKILDPKPNCRKCNGRGYLGIRVDPVTNKATEIPVPCPCIYPKPTTVDEKIQRDSAQHIQSIKYMNRKQRREKEKLMKKKG